MKLKLFPLIIPLLMLVIGCSGITSRENGITPGMDKALPTSISQNLPLMVESMDACPVRAIGIEEDVTGDDHE